MIKDIVSRDITKKDGNYYVKKLAPTGGMLLVKNDWCMHCRKLAPILEQVSKKLGKAFPIVKLDGDSNNAIVQALGVEGFPTIFYVERDGLISKRYEGERSDGAFLQAICDKSLVCRK